MVGMGFGWMYSLWLGWGLVGLGLVGLFWFVGGG